ncbi:HAD family hydrolase [Streptomyces sp. NPDC001530]|uniref:HAD family hydrolase n=1 Tax=Streptomyces sp. NPDC001530 TaxID=3364582 RepID=UPI0036809830
MRATKPMADALDDREALRSLLDSTQAVLFDFDGPVCDLFAGRPTTCVADKIKAETRRAWGALDQDVEDCHDAHGVLRRLREAWDRPAPTSRSCQPLEWAEAAVTMHEYAAVTSAEPAAGVVGCVDLLLDLGRRLMIVSDTAEGPVREYLERAGLEAKFEAVRGRDPHDARRVKPDPDCLIRSLNHLGLPPDSCLFIGDQLTDLMAARSASIRFLGYARDEERATAMRRAGADGVVASHAPVMDAARLLLS